MDRINHDDDEEDEGENEGQPWEYTERHVMYDSYLRQKYYKIRRNTGSSSVAINQVIKEDMEQDLQKMYR